MTLTLELTAEEDARLQEKARRAGMAPAELLRQFIVTVDTGPYDPPADPRYSGTWAEEDMRDATYASLCRLDEELGPEDGYDA